MTVRELIDRLLAKIQSGELRGSDPVPGDLLEDDHLDPVEYLSQKYNIRGDGNGSGDCISGRRDNGSGNNGADGCSGK